MARTFVILGLVLIAAGLLWPWLTRLGLGNLPGDISVRRSNLQFYLPVTSSIIVSVVLSLIFWIVSMIRR
jgi:Protein of unknown function (DUF2905)